MLVLARTNQAPQQRTTISLSLSLSFSVSLILCLSSLVTCLAVSLQRCPDKPPTDPSYTDAVPWLSMPIETCSSQAEEKGSKSKTFSLGIRPSFLGGPARLNQALSTSFKVIKPGPTSQINQKKQMQILSSYLYPQSCEQFNPSRVLVPEPSHFAQKSSKLGGQGTSSPSSAKHSTDLRLFSPPDAIQATQVTNPFISRTDPGCSSTYRREALGPEEVRVRAWYLY
ncbi:hypothetical protein V8C40DRAFT_64752 [Trichoderma camerunense]